MMFVNLVVRETCYYMFPSSSQKPVAKTTVHLHGPTRSFPHSFPGKVSRSALHPPISSWQRWREWWCALLLNQESSGFHCFFTAKYLSHKQSVINAAHCCSSKRIICLPDTSGSLRHPSRWGYASGLQPQHDSTVAFAVFGTENNGIDHQEGCGAVV